MGFEPMTYAVAVYYESTRLPAFSWLVSSVGRALNRWKLIPERIEQNFTLNEERQYESHVSGKIAQHTYWSDLGILEEY